MKFGDFISRIKPRIQTQAKDMLGVRTDGLILSEGEAFSIVEGKENVLCEGDIIVDSDYLLSSDIAVAEKYKVLEKITERKSVKHLKMTKAGTICNAVLNSGVLSKDSVYTSASCKIVTQYFESDFVVLPGDARDLFFDNSAEIIFVNISAQLLENTEPETLAFNIVDRLSKLDATLSKNGINFVLFDSSAYNALRKSGRVRMFSILNSLSLLAFECSDVKEAKFACESVFSSVETHMLKINEIKKFCMHHEAVKLESYVKTEIAEKYDRIFLGGCASGDYETLKEIAEFITGKTLHSNLEVIVTPADFNVYQRAAESGILVKLSKAGFTVVFPSCASCKGKHSGILASSEVALSTFPLSEPGRMGHSKAQIYRCSVKSILEKIMH